MKYKAIALDLDGTLMNSKNTISEKTLQSLIEIQKQGVKVILASGRPTKGLMRASEALKLKEYGGYILPFNGGRIIDVKNDRLLFEASLSKETVWELSDAAKEFGVNILAYKDDYIITDGDNQYIRLESRINELPVHRVGQIKTAVNSGSIKCLMTAEPEYLAKIEIILKARYEGKLSFSRSMPFFLECMPFGIDKGSCLKILLDKLNIPIEEAIAAGDGYNDVTMVEIAGLGVAMANGCEPVKAKAKFTTLSNDEDGIAHVINQFILNEENRY